MYIIGAGILGEIAAAVLRRNQRPLFGFYDDFAAADEFCGAPVLGKISELDDNADAPMADFFVAVGDNGNRAKVSGKLAERGIKQANIIDAGATLEDDVQLGGGNLIMAGAYIGTGCRIGSGNVVFPGVCLTHHNTVGDFNFFSPNASIGGHTKICGLCKFSMNCAVAPYVTVTAGTLVPPVSFFAG